MFYARNIFLIAVLTEHLNKISQINNHFLRFLNFNDYQNVNYGKSVIMFNYFPLFFYFFLNVKVIIVRYINKNKAISLRHTSNKTVLFSEQ